VHIQTEGPKFLTRATLPQLNIGMIDIKDCYTQLTLPPMPRSYYYGAVQARYRGPLNRQHGWDEYPTGISTAHSTQFEHSLLGKKIRKDFNNAVSFDYMRFDPGTFYHFHADLPTVDGTRLCGINVLLSDSPDAMTLFKVGEKNEAMWRVEPVDYVRYQPILFNTQVMHSVLTLRSVRYVFTITVWNQSYEYMLDYLSRLDPEDVKY